MKYEPPQGTPVSWLGVSEGLIGEHCTPYLYSHSNILAQSDRSQSTGRRGETLNFWFYECTYPCRRMILISLVSTRRSSAASECVVADAAGKFGTPLDYEQASFHRSVRPIGCLWRMNWVKSKLRPQNLPTRQTNSAIRSSQNCVSRPQGAQRNYGTTKKEIKKEKQNANRCIPRPSLETVEIRHAVFGGKRLTVLRLRNLQMEIDGDRIRASS